MIRLGDQVSWNDKGLEALRYEYDLGPDDWVVDVGAYQGEFAARIFRKFNCNVLAFEPTDAIDKLINLTTKVRVRKQAAWIHNSRIKMGGSQFWISMYDPDREREYPCIDLGEALRTVLDQTGFNIGLLKINIEGGEYMLLQHLLNQRLQLKITHLQVQFHLVDGEDSEKKYEAIAAQLRGTHELVWRTPFVWESWKLKMPS